MATQQVIVSGYLNNPSNVGIEYNHVNGGYIWQTPEDDSYQIIPTSGTFKKLSVKMNGSPNAGKSYTFTLRVNGADSILTVTISDAETTESFEADVVVSSGDRVTMKCEPSGTPDAHSAIWNLIWEPDIDNEFILLGGHDNQKGNVNPEYNALSGPQNWDTEVEVRQKMPCNGTLKRLFVWITPNPANGSYDFIVRIEGADTTIVVNIADAATTGNDIIHTAAVSAGDIIALKCVPVDTPNNPIEAHWGIVFVPDTDGEAPLLRACDWDLDVDDIKYNGINGQNTEPWHLTEANRIQLTQAMTLKNLYVEINIAIGGDDGWTFTVMVNGVPTSLSVSITATETEESDTVNTVEVADGDEISLRCEPVDVPVASRKAFWGLVGFKEPDVAGQPLMMDGFTFIQ